MPNILGWLEARRVWWVMRASTVNWVAFFVIYEPTCDADEDIGMDIYHGWGFTILVLPSLPG